MPKPTTKAPASTWWDRVMPAFLTRDAKALRTAMADADGPGDITVDEDEDDETKKDLKETKDAVASLARTVDSLTKSIATLVKTRDADGDETPEEKAAREKKEKETNDDVALASEQAAKFDGGEVMTGDSLVALMSRVEILAPGTAMPTGDAVSGKGMSGRLMRAALVKATADAKMAAVIAPVLAGVDVKTATFDALRPAFAAAVELARAANNSNGRGVRTVTTRDFGRAISPAEMNAKATAFWTPKAGA